MLKKLSLIVCFVSTIFAMNSAEININDVDLEVGAKFDVGQFNENVEPETIFVGAKFLNVDKKYSSNKNLTTEPYYEANFLTQRTIEGKGISFGMGVKVNYTKNYTTIPLGLEFMYKLPEQELMPIYIGASIYYAPSSLSFADADSFLEYRATFDIEIIKNGHIYVGFRSLNTNYTQYKYNYNRAWYSGFKFSF